MAKGPFLARLIEACREHGAQSEPDMEVGDLQMVVRMMWASMTNTQQQLLSREDELVELIDTWLGDAQVPAWRRRALPACTKCGSPMHRCKTGDCIHCDDENCTIVMRPAGPTRWVLV